MKIKAVEEKPVVIRRKKNPRLHLHMGGKTVRHKKVANTVRVSEKSGRKTPEQRKMPAGKGQGGWKERADSSIKIKNRSLRTFASAGARTGMEQMEGGEEVAESMDVMMAVSSPVVGVSKKSNGTLPETEGREEKTEEKETGAGR